MEPLITLSHYEMPLHLATAYNGWNHRKTIDFFVKYADTVMRRYKDKVKYWIVVNQINLIHHESFNHLGIPSDRVSNLMEAKYQGIHNECTASAIVTKIGHEINPDFQIGMMVYDGLSEPLTCKPEDVFANMQRNQREYFFSDLLLRGEYPGYMLRYFQEHDIRLDIREEDERMLKENPADFLAISYYYTCASSSESNSCADVNDDGAVSNPYIEASEWGWGIDPLGLRTVLNYYYDRYQKPIIIAENGFGTFDEISSDGCIHDERRIAYLREHIRNMKEAIMDGVEVIGYYPWGPIDIISCSSSEMSKRYGFIYVDQDDYGNGTKRRLKKSTGQKAKKKVVPVAVREVKVGQANAQNAPVVSQPKQQAAEVSSSTSVTTKSEIQKTTAGTVAPSLVSTQKYHVIIASVGTEKDAEAMAKQLIEKGYPHAKAIVGDGKMRVSIESCGTETEAYQALNRVRQNETYKNAWVLKK